MLPEQATGWSCKRAEFHRRGNGASAVKVYASDQYSQKRAEPFQLLGSFLTSEQGYGLCCAETPFLSFSVGIYKEIQMCVCYIVNSISIVWAPVMFEDVPMRKYHIFFFTCTMCGALFTEDWLCSSSQWPWEVGSLLCPKRHWGTERWGCPRKVMQLACGRVGIQTWRLRTECQELHSPPYFFPRHDVLLLSWVWPPVAGSQDVRAISWVAVVAEWWCPGRRYPVPPGSLDTWLKEPNWPPLSFASTNCSVWKAHYIPETYVPLKGASYDA